jgi:hypothetical protein
MRSKESLPAGVLALLDETLNLLRTSTRGDHQRVRHVDDDKIVNTEASDETARTGDDDASS